jgi:glycosyl transferase family 2
MTPTMPSLLSVIIPGYNRVAPLRFTLRSVAHAAARLGTPVEILLVDDGSSPPLEDQLRQFEAGAAVSHLTQTNQGSIVARQTGLRAANGEFVQFLDSDDVVHPEKFVRQIDAMRRNGADVSYADMAVATLGANDEVARFEPAEVLAEALDSSRLFIELQPAPHNPVYRRSYLQRALANPLIKAERSMDPSGDVWMYYNIATYPAKIVKVAGALCAPGPHEEDRFSRHWEKLGVAALQIMEAFMGACPDTPESNAARRAVGEAAFRSWRGLPRDFSSEFVRRMLGVYTSSPTCRNDRLGTPTFSRLATLVGPVNAGRLIRMLRARPYSEVRTLSSAEYDQLFGRSW